MAPKAAMKKAVVKKTVTKKTTTMKAVAMKAVAMKAVAKKAVAKKAEGKKAAPKEAAPEGAPKVGKPAPDFHLEGTDGKTHSLAAHRGHPVILYFYPKDDTPGCTREACHFRDHMAVIKKEKRGTVVLGVSRDSIESHKKFAAKHLLNFPLLSDKDLSAHRAYGAWGTKVMYGRQVEGTVRSTFLIDGAGVLRASWPKVNIEGHAELVIRSLKKL